MEKTKKSRMLSVIDIAEICGVARSTVSYWIAKKSLPAQRYGKKFLVPLEELILFLRSEKIPIPDALLNGVDNAFAQPVRSFKRCWEFWEKSAHGDTCKECIAFTNGIETCFTVKNGKRKMCRMNCSQCQYFDEYYGLQMSFIYQFHKPAAIFKGLYIWLANAAWARLCGISTEDIIGTGIEEILRPDSLKTVITYGKRWVQGDKNIQDRYPIILGHQSGKNIEVYLSMNALKRPVGAFLAVAEQTIHTAIS